MMVRPRPLFRFVVPAQMGVIIIYLWYLTAGLWTTLPAASSSDLYNQLATAFGKGQLYLERNPDPDLLALRDPYAIQQRRYVSSYIGDATLFKGRYYLYWGPVPAVALALVRYAGYPGVIGDAHLVFVFVAGLFLMLSSLIVSIWRRHHADVPGLILLLSVLLVGLAPPLTWILGNPLIYEAALASAEFFFVTGLATAYWALSKAAPTGGPLLLAGVSWALAIGCQFTQILPVGVALSLSTLWVLRMPPLGLDRTSRPGLLAGLWLPTMLILAALAWYNHARFGSVLEFGYRYQLAVVNLHEHYGEIFQPVFALPNLYNYILNPIQFGAMFPFLFPKYGSILRSLPFPIPRLYYSEAITGLLYTAPIILYALLPAVSAARRFDWKALRSWMLGLGLEPFGWLRLAMIGALVPNVAVLLFFYYSAPRYLLSVMPMLIVLAIIGFWQSLRHLSRRPLLLRLNLVAAAILTTVTVAVSSLLAISSSQDHFLTANPALIERINSLLHP